MMAQQRATAYKTIIDDVKGAEYVKQEAPHPNYLDLYNEQVRRVQIIAVLVQKSSHHFVLDDGSGQLTAKRFDKAISMDNVESGDAVLVIGRPRSHDDTVFIGAETVKALNDKDWVSIHQDIVEALYDRDAETEAEQMTSTMTTENETTVNYTEDLLDSIRDHDDGDGAPTNKVIESSDLDDPEEYVEVLINEGEIFEIRPGRLKIL